MPKLLHFIVHQPTDAVGFELYKPAVSDGDRARAILERLRAAQPNKTLDVLEIEQSNAPGWKALGDKMSDDEIVEGDFS